MRGAGEIDFRERVAFIPFTNIYRSTQLWEKYPQEFGGALEKHYALIEDTVVSHGQGDYEESWRRIYRHI